MSTLRAFGRAAGAAAVVGGELTATDAGPDPRAGGHASANRKIAR